MFLALIYIQEIRENVVQNVVSIVVFIIGNHIVVHNKDGIYDPSLHKDTNDTK